MFYCISKWFIMFCLFIQITEIDAFLKLGYSPSLVIINQEDESSHLNHLGIEINQIQGFHSQNFCAIFAERNAKFFFLCVKKTTICAIIRKSHFAQNCPILLLRNSSFAQFCNQSFCAIPQFRKNQTVGESMCFLEFNSGRILFWNVFLLVTNLHN